MNALRKVLIIVGLSWLIWSLSLLWPGLNLALVLAVVVAVAVLAGSVGLALLWWQHRHQSQANRARPRHPSRPIAVH